MASEKRSRVEEVLSAALDHDPGERLAFLKRACGSDAELFREVESLLGWTAGRSLAGRAQVAQLAEEIEEEQPSLSAGETVGRYEVLGKIGTGGMGEVYLARDTSLGRQVALKLLPRTAVLHHDRVRRFMQEAHAVSALNHPNILTIHEVGQSGTIHYIVMEYVEGETLRKRLQRAPLRFPEALKVAAQVGDALSAAHSAGIIHRDIKPDNIMLRKDGYLKVLDFGLAKLTENLAPLERTDFEAPTRQAVRTNPGVVMGTPEYMSPEQARGLEVDHRTDVWSLGVVLYEMVAGRRPFEGPTHGDTIVSILERDPAPLARQSLEVPAELERIVTKALAKDAEERYQTVKDMTIDLKRLKKRLEAEAELQRSASAEMSGDAAATDRHALAALALEQGATRTNEVRAAASTSSLEYAVTEIRRHKAGVAVGGILIITALAGAGYGLLRLLSRNETRPQPTLEKMKISQVTTDGTARATAISPDGKYVAYVLRDAGRETLRVRQVATSSDLQVVPLAEAFFIGLTFSPDNDYLYYVTLQTRGSPGSLSDSAVSGTLYRATVLGGVSRKLLTGLASPVTFSPDGGRLAFVRAYPDRGESALMVANADGSGEQILARRTPPDVHVSNGRYGSGPAWSPDGKVIACGVGRFARQHVVAISAVDGSEKLLGSQSWQFVGRLAWFPDGSGLVMTARDQSLSSQVWQLSYPAGEARRITNDLNSYADVSLNADAASLVTVQYGPLNLSLWVVAPGEDPARAKKIVSAAGTYEVSWTPDGRLVYSANSGDRMNLWVVNQDGTEPKQLTAFTNSVNGRPSVSPDGRYIVFGSDRAGTRTRNIWRVDSDGSNPVQLTSGEGETWPTFSPDGRWVIYSAIVSGKYSLRKVPIDGGDPIQLTGTVGFLIPSVSPDGKMIAYVDREERAGSPDRIVVIPFEGGDPVKTFDLPPTFEHAAVRWTPDGRALTFTDIRNGVENIWTQPLGGGAPRQITDFKSEGIGMFDWSRDGKQLALWRGTENRNVVLINDFR
jgi:Tol biopolymer transport system component/aminoglycoside phosphotransferase (APT) family kinase protein